MTAVNDDLPETELEAEDEDSVEEDFDEGEEDGEIDGFEEEPSDDDGEDIDAVVELSGKELSARSLEVRRAIEEQMEKRRLQEDLDYLDLDFED